MVDMHYADPSKALMLAKALNVYPSKVFLVGCQPEYVDDAVEGLRPSVERGRSAGGERGSDTCPRTFER
ncbi:hypothetical protein BH20ACI2_BH20ACI2_11200 [soil metagenome]